MLVLQPVDDSVLDVVVVEGDSFGDLHGSGVLLIGLCDGNRDAFLGKAQRG